MTAAYFFIHLKKEVGEKIQNRTSYSALWAFYQKDKQHLGIMAYQTKLENRVQTYPYGQELFF